MENPVISARTFNVMRLFVRISFILIPKVLSCIKSLLKINVAENYSINMIELILIEVPLQLCLQTKGDFGLDKRKMNRVLLASLIGSSIEWFDYFLYGTVAALVFNQVFRVTEDPSVGLILAYASFALAFFIRPFGGTDLQSYW